MSFLLDLNSALREESTLNIKIRILKKIVVFRVLDSNKKGIKGVNLKIGKKDLGITDENGVLKVEKYLIPKKGTVKAFIGIYYGSKSFNL